MSASRHNAISQLARLKIMAGITDKAQDRLLSLYLQEAIEFMSEYTGRDLTSVPLTLLGTQVEIALISYNRRGIEGMSQADEGGVRRSLDALPENIKRALEMHRVGRSLGRASTQGRSTSYA